MNTTINIVWKKILEESKNISSQNKSIIMYADSYDLFKSNFIYYCNLIKNNFMQDPKENLDRHKIAAVIICSILNNGLLGISAKEKGKYDNNVFLGNEKLALNVALSYMYEELKIAYTNNAVPYENIFQEYVFPTPYSCNRSFDLVICRDLYYMRTYFKLDPLTIANFLFLLEDYSFKVYGITPKSEVL